MIDTSHSISHRLALPCQCSKVLWVKQFDFIHVVGKDDQIIARSPTRCKPCSMGISRITVILGSGRSISGLSIQLVAPSTPAVPTGDETGSYSLPQEMV